MRRFLTACVLPVVRSVPFWLAVLALFCFAGPLQSARADITPAGDVSPSDPSTWDSSTDGYIGNTASGTLTVEGRGISSHFGYLGYDSAATGVVNVAGTISRWTTYGVCVGYSGSGTLSLANGGRLLSQVNSESNASYIGYNSGSTGLLTVDGLRSTWTNEYDVYVGNSGSGAVSVSNGGSVSSALHSYQGNIFVGYAPGSKGVVAVDGAGSKWNGYGTFRVGWLGSGTLSITNGGSVTAAQTWLGTNAGSTGMIDFGTNGGTLTTGALFASPSQLTGTGTVIAYGLVSDIDLRFDSTHGLAQVIPFQQSGQNVTVNLVSTADALGAGWKGQGSLSIRDGITVNSFEGYIGYGSESTGMATVSGSGSTWNVKRGLFCVGNSGSGTLSITSGGSVSCSQYYTYIGNAPGSKGAVMVDGAGSTWNTMNPLTIGNSGSGTLSITNGSSVSAGVVWVGRSVGSTGMIDFGANGGTLTTAAILVSPTQLAGTGTVIARGLVSDIDLKFDSDHGLAQVIPLQQPGQNVSVSLDVTGTAPILGAGWKDRGSLAILDGRIVRSSEGYIGYGNGSTGVATVSGSGSTWNVPNGDFSVGERGSGTLSISNGGTMNFGHAGNQCHVGGLPGAKGVVLVDGTGSNWTISVSSFASIGSGGSGTLSITNGGSVNGGAIIGSGFGSTGVVTVDGAGSTWVNAGPCVGDYGGGTLSITNGGKVSSYGSTIGAWYGSTGVVKVDGDGSIWTSEGSITIGNRGGGTLSIVNGGSVTVVNGTTFVARDAASTGMIDFGTNGGTLTTGSLLASPTQLAGTGTIITRGLVSDLEVLFDSAHGLKQAIPVHQSGQNVTINLDLATDPNTNGTLGAGWRGAGSLTVRDGLQVRSALGYLGYGIGSTGVATVSGAGSAWTCGSTMTSSSYLYIGYRGSGSLSITGGGAVKNINNYAGCTIGCYLGSKGLAALDGTGSTWTCDGDLSVGGNGNGTLSISGGGAAAAGSVLVGNSTSLLAIDVGRGSLLTVGGGTGTVTNNGTIRVLAGAGVPTDATPYSPILAGKWAGTGTCQAVGGTWDATGHTCTASSVTAGASGSSVVLDLATVQRALIDGDGPNGINWQLVASFVAAGTTSNMTFTAAAASGSVLDTLKATVGEHREILDAWTFSTDGYTLSANNPVYFSLNVGPGHSAEDLNLWQFDGTSWAAYAPTDLTYDGIYASFTATGMSGYAATTVPEPGTLALLAAGFLGLAAYARRKRLRVQ